MASYHVLDGSDDGNSFKVVFHIPIPVANNRVNVPYQTAVAEFFGEQKSIIPGITAAEQADLTAGKVVEVVTSVNTNPGETAAALQTRLDALYTVAKNAELLKLQKRLAYWGFSKTLP